MEEVFIKFIEFLIVLLNDELLISENVFYEN